VSTRNVDPHPSRFRVDPAVHIQLNRQLRGTRRAVVGVYHSHPTTSAEPSLSDIDEAYYADFVHVIVSLVNPTQPDIRAYRIIQGVASSVAMQPTSALRRT
jgi:[CysO sulfur-carrier protein]-S-L-cysteine hydrolase